MPLMIFSVVLAAYILRRLLSNHAPLILSAHLISLAVRKAKSAYPPRSKQMAAEPCWLRFEEQRELGAALGRCGGLELGPRSTSRDSKRCSREPRRGGEGTWEMVSGRKGKRDIGPR